MAPLVYEAGSWEIDAGQRELRRSGVPVAIGSRAFRVIEKLVESAGQLVSKDDLIAHVWPGADVGENTLQVHIAAIRKALGLDRTMLRTASGRGYRLLGGWRLRTADESKQGENRDQARRTALPSTNLPARVTTLVGRSNAFELLRDLLTAYRIVTLTGVGGIGKTVLATEVARSVTGDFDEGVWIVELAGLSDSSLVASATAGTIGLRLNSETISPEAVARAVGERELLLVLDNCEHVVIAAAELTQILVKNCPNITVLATSRQLLKAIGECEYRVPPLDVPTTDSEELGRLLKRSAVELFIARTQALNSDFSPHADNEQAIAAICRRLDGVPLAIEFAAARTATLGVEEVAAGLSDRFKLLSSRRRTKWRRHQTLRATLDWSYELLPEQEKRLLQYLAVFPGGFTLDAVRSLTQPGDATDAADIITNLVAKSLVVFDATSTPNRWRLLETIRAYALEKLVESGEYPLIARLHAKYFCDLIVPAAASSMVRLSRENVARFSRELDNVRAALDWSFSPDGDVKIGAALTAAFASIWMYMSLVGECRDRVERVFAIQGFELNLDPAVERQMCIAYGTAVAMTLAPVERTRAVVARAQHLAEGIDNAELQLQLLWAKWSTAMASGECRLALATVQQLSSFAQLSGDEAMRLMSDRYLGTSLLDAGRLPEARASLQRVVDSYVAPEDGHRPTLFQYDELLMARAKLARVRFLSGEIDDAFKEARLSFEQARPSHAGTTLCWVLQDGICPIALLTGDLETADEAVAAMSEWATRVDAALWKNLAMCWQGKLLIARGEFEQGRLLVKQTLEVCEQSGWRICHSEFLGFLAQALAGLGKLDDACETILRAIAWAEHYGEGWYLPELIRMKGEFLLQRGGPAFDTEAEDCLRKASELAREQNALFWELRIAVSLARFRMTQGRHVEARAILVPLYARFAEGLETADLLAARSILESGR
jgi:predicted ATPase/DNA-binding winged helix-turn-helix (wHTH) protein